MALKKKPRFFYRTGLFNLKALLFFEDRPDLDISVGNFTMITLKIDGPWNKFTSGDGSTGATQNRLIVDDGFSV